MAGEIARPAGEFVSRYGRAAALPAPRLIEEHLARATRAPQRIPVELVRILTDHAGCVVLLDQAPDSGGAAHPRDDAHE
jgi:hypothetical protein